MKKEIKTVNLKVDFDKAIGKIKAMHGVGQPPMTGLSNSLFKYLTRAGIPYSRLHDVGGWLGGNYPGVNADLFCESKSSPGYIMSIKIIQNEGPYAYTDFEMLSMPTEVEGEVDDTCQLLEWEDDPEQIAIFFWGEWIRMMETLECGGYC